MNNTQNPARSIALLILFITAVASGFALIFLTYGNRNLSLILCGGGIALNIVVLVFGGVLVGASETSQDE